MSNEIFLQEEQTEENASVTGSESGEPATSDPDPDSVKAVSGTEKKKIPKSVREFIVRITATVFIVWFSLAFLLGVYVCHSDNCYPMVKDGDLCITWKPASLSQDDLIVYSSNGENRFGRVAAVSGDIVKIINGVVWVNGYVVQSETLPADYDSAIETAFPLTVPENSVFVLSDNTADLNDSRSCGAIPLDNCRGKVVFMMRRRGF